MVTKYFLIFVLLFSFSNADNLPIVVSTWRFVDAAATAWKTVVQKSALDAIEAGCSVCEREQCDGTVGYGGSPDEDGETTLDAMIMDGNTMNVGAVISMGYIKNAISVARLVLEHTAHSILAGEKATNFAKQMGFTKESLTTDTSKKIWQQWKDRNCQPNYWQNVIPDPKKSCGPYKLSEIWKALVNNKNRYDFNIGPENHDTIGMIAVDKSGNVAAGTSTNGATHKIPGRVGDSAIPGAGSYADSTVGAAAATGDGDVMLRFSPSFLAVEEMRRGSTPSQASEIAIKRIASYYPSFSGGVVAVDKSGNYGAACHGMETFPFSVADNSSNAVRVETVTCNETNEV